LVSPTPCRPKAATAYREALAEYVRRVTDGSYPGPEHNYTMSDAEREKFLAGHRF